MADLRKILEHTKILEGGWTIDQGGKTMYGVTESTLKSYQSRTGKLQGVRIENLTWDQAVQIYAYDYWRPIKGDLIRSQNAAAVIFDYAVNSGPGQAVKDLQRVLNDLGNNLSVDGGLGPQTIAALNKAGEKIVKPYLARREQFFRYLAEKNPARHASSLKGWLKRLERLESFLEPVKKKIGLVGLGLGFTGLILWRINKSNK